SRTDHVNPCILLCARVGGLLEVGDSATCKLPFFRVSRISIYVNNPAGPCLYIYGLAGIDFGTSPPVTVKFAVCDVSDFAWYNPPKEILAVCLFALPASWIFPPVVLLIPNRSLSIVKPILEPSLEER